MNSWWSVCWRLCLAWVVAAPHSAWAADKEALLLPTRIESSATSVATERPTPPAQPTLPEPPETDAAIPSAAPDADGQAVDAAPSATPTRAVGTPIPNGPLSDAAQHLDRVLEEAVADFGLVLKKDPNIPPDYTELQLIQWAQDAWVFAPSVAADGHQVRLRIAAVAPHTDVLLVRNQLALPEDLEVRALAMMRDLIHASNAAPAARHLPPPTPPAAPARQLATVPTSAGRAILGLNSAILGGYVGYSLQRAAGSNDARLTYPLMALGTGIGLGAAMVIAEEWDVDVGEAWFLSAGTLWPALSGLTLSKHYDVQPDSDRFVYGLLGAASGLTLSTVALGFSPEITEGDAVLAHSGGALGSLMGGLTEMMIEGRTGFTPLAGLGFGAGAGVVAAGLAATQIDQLSASQVLLLDLSATLGALTGAAAASPLVFADEDSRTNNRWWLASIATGTVAGAVIGYWVLPDDESAERTGVPVLPFVSVTEERLPVAGVVGSW